MVTILILSLILLFAASVPITVSLGTAGFLSIIFGSNTPTLIVCQRLVGGIDSFALMALPFFIFAANVMDSGGLSKRLLHWARALVGHVSGGIAVSTQLASMFFGALSGSSPATIVAIGKIMYPEMKERKYPNNFIGGLLASSGSVALIIPPSVTIIIYCVTTGTSVGKCFMAGISAGIIFGLSAIAYIYWYAKKHNLPKDRKASRTEVHKATKDAFAALMVPIIILGGIYSGLFTPTEAAAISAIYAILIGMFVYKELDIKKLWEVAVNSAISTAQVLVLMSSATILGWVLTYSKVSATFTNALLGGVHSKFLFLLIVNVILLIMGMFMDGAAAILIIAPLIYQPAIALGINAVHLCLVMISNLAIGMYTPPFGMNLFITNSITKMDMLDMLPGVWPFLVVNLIALAAITYFPGTILFLPNLIG